VDVVCVSEVVGGEVRISDLEFRISNFISWGRRLWMVWALACVVTGCSRPKIVLVSEDVPPSFKLTGSNIVQHFKITNEKSGQLWLLYPKGNDVSLSDLGTIKYGSVPACCYQSIPNEKGTAPPPLKEGESYASGAVIFDDAPVVVKFSIKNGKAIVQP